MKHVTIVFCKILSGLYQQGILTSKKKDMLLDAWQKAIKAEDRMELKKLINELACMNTNRIWQTELNNILEEL